eukprot:1776916-Prymnesium_polylepis.1
MMASCDGSSASTSRARLREPVACGAAAGADAAAGSTPSTSAQSTPDSTASSCLSRVSRCGSSAASLPRMR